MGRIVAAVVMIAITASVSGCESPAKRAERLEKAEREAREDVVRKKLESYLSVAKDGRQFLYLLKKYISIYGDVDVPEGYKILSRQIRFLSTDSEVNETDSQKGYYRLGFGYTKGWTKTTYGKAFKNELVQWRTGNVWCTAYNISIKLAWNETIMPENQYCTSNFKYYTDYVPNESEMPDRYHPLRTATEERGFLQDNAIVAAIGIGIAAAAAKNIADTLAAPSTGNYLSDTTGAGSSAPSGNGCGYKITTEPRQGFGLYTDRMVSELKCTGGNKDGDNIKMITKPGNSSVWQHTGCLREIMPGAGCTGKGYEDFNSAALSACECK